jgi:hypothetical protein
MKNFVAAASPGDDLNDAAAVFLSDMTGEVASRALVANLRVYARVGLAGLDLAIFAVRSTWSYALISADLLTSGDTKLMLDDTPGRLANRPTELFPEKRAHWASVLERTNQLTVVDFAAEVIMWLIFASFTDDYARDPSTTQWGQSAGYGAVAGVLSLAYRDLVVLVLGTPAQLITGSVGMQRNENAPRVKHSVENRMRRQLKTRSFWRSYVTKALQSASLFIVYNEFLYTVFEAEAPVSALLAKGIDGAAGGDFLDIFESREARVDPLRDVLELFEKFYKKMI